MEIDLGSWMGQVGVGGIFVILVLRLVFDFLKERKDHQTGATPSERKVHVVLQKVELIEKQIQALYDWHNKEDQDGVKVWYLRSSFEDAILRLSTAIEQQTTVLAEVAREQKQTNDAVSRLVQSSPRSRAESGT